MRRKEQLIGLMRVNGAVGSPSDSVKVTMAKAVKKSEIMRMGRSVDMQQSTCKSSLDLNSSDSRANGKVYNVKTNRN